MDFWHMAQELRSETRYCRKDKSKGWVTGRRGKRRKQLLNDCKVKRRQGKQEEDALDRTLWRTCFGGGYGPVLTLILRRSRTGTVWFYTSTSNKRAARPKLYTKSLTRDLKLMYSRFTLVRISINLQAPRFFYIGTGVSLLFRERFLYI